jgi:LytS/YehU family sensor histidine kinase
MKSGSLIQKIYASSWFLAAIPAILLSASLFLLNISLNVLSAFIFFTVSYLILFIFSIALRRLSRRDCRTEVNREIINLNLKSIQLQGLKAQLDPHFIFNILNTVASLIYLDDREKAYDYMIKFTQLLRGIFNDSEDIYRSLGDELELVNTYLELEKLRFGEKLKYNVRVGENVTRKEQVPKFVIQTFAENSVNYGILPLTGQGVLNIIIMRENGFIKVTIDDNGVKRSAAGGLGRTAAQRLDLTKEIFRILNQMNEKKLEYKISDIYSDDKTPAGTRVEVYVPLIEII